MIEIELESEGHFGRIKNGILLNIKVLAFLEFFIQHIEYITADNADERERKLT